MASETVNPIDWSLPPASWAGSPERLVISINVQYPRPLPEIDPAAVIIHGNIYRGPLRGVCTPIPACVGPKHPTSPSAPSHLAWSRAPWLRHPWQQCNLMPLI